MDFVQKVTKPLITSPVNRGFHVHDLGATDGIPGNRLGRVRCTPEQSFIYSDLIIGSLLGFLIDRMLLTRQGLTYWGRVNTARRCSGV